jgi:hypothetical protein
MHHQLSVSHRLASSLRFALHVQVHERSRRAQSSTAMSLLYLISHALQRKSLARPWSISPTHKLQRGETHGSVNISVSVVDSTKKQTASSHWSFETLLHVSGRLLKRIRPTQLHDGPNQPS